MDIFSETDIYSSVDLQGEFMAPREDTRVRTLPASPDDVVKIMEEEEKGGGTVCQTVCTCGQWIASKHRDIWLE